MNVTRPRPRSYFYVAGSELSGHPCNGREVLGFGTLSGQIGNTPCFESITVRTTVDEDLTEASFGDQPVMVKVWTPNNKPAWFAIATAATVDDRNAARRAAANR